VPSPGLRTRSNTVAGSRPATSAATYLHPSPPELTAHGAKFFAGNPDSTSVEQESSTRPSTRCSKISEEPSSPDSFHGGDDAAWTAKGEKKESQNQDQDEDEEEVDDIEVAAQISIARQISLSRRQLLVPVVPKNQMLVSRKSIKDEESAPLKPRLVEHRRMSVSKSQPPPPKPVGKTEETVVEEVEAKA
jgi:hypothetical protein